MLGEIISIVMLILLMALVPIFLQLKAYEINDDYFKRIKIRRFSFMFKAIGGQSAAKRGVILPMLIIQVIGYISALVAIIITCIMLFIVNNENNMQIVTIVNLSIFGVDILTSVVTFIITSIVSRKREENNYIPKKK